MNRLLLLVLVAPACTSKDTNFEDLDSAGNYIGPMKSTDCHYQSASTPFDLDGDGNFETCSTYDADVSIIDATGAAVTDASIYANADAVTPADYIDTRIWALTVASSGGGSVWRVYPDDQVYTAAESGKEYPGTTSGDLQWFSFFPTDDIGPLNDCSPDCSYYAFGTEIADSDMADSDTCDVYDDVTSTAWADGDLQVCVTLEWTTTTEPSPVPCAPGHGRFQLVPTHYQDWDGDGKMGVLWRGVQETGRTALTSDAIVTKIAVVDDHGVALRVMHSDKTFSFGDDDTLVASASASTLLSDAKATSFRGRTTGSVLGSAPFVSESYPRDVGYPEVDETWTCPLAGTASDSGSASLPQGYSFSLGDIGCDDYAVQRITVRLVPETNPAYAQLELYGEPLNNLKAQLRRNAGRWYFDYRERGFEVAGSLGEHGARHGADVTFDVIRYLGVDVCATGDYTFSKEL